LREQYGLNLFYNTDYHKQIGQTWQQLNSRRATAILVFNYLDVRQAQLADKLQSVVKNVPGD